MGDWEGFAIEGRLGVGTTGTVWLATQRSVGRHVALKELAPELAGDPQVRERLRAEAQLLAQLENPNCVSVYSYLETDAAAAIVMEYVDGMSLREVAGHGPLSTEQALAVLEGALGGLAYAHQRGIVHGDLKPENILLSRGGESKLVDFGLAAAVGTRRAPGTGSPTYSSPEAAAGEPLGTHTDLYSAGLVLYELLTGSMPVGGGVALRDDAAWDALPLPVVALVRQALAADPAERPQNAETFLADLREAADSGCGKDWRRRAVLAPLVAGALGAVAAVGAAKAGASTPSIRSDASGTAPHRSRLGHLLHAHPVAVGATAVAVVVAAVAVGFVATSGSSSGGAHPVATPTTASPPKAAASANAAAVSTLSAADLENATLPGAVCAGAGGDGTSDAPPIPLTGGKGQSPITDGGQQVGFTYASILGSPVAVNFGSGHQGVAASILCSQGGSFEFSNVWVFGGTPADVSIVFGPVPQRSYAAGTYGVDYNNLQSTDVHGVGNTLVVSESYSPADTCAASGGICPAEYTTTTWHWTPATPDRLVIAVPRPLESTVLVPSTPTSVTGDKLSGRSAVGPLSVGQRVLVVCSNAQLSSGPRMVELDDGTWLPVADVKTVTVPDCDTPSGPQGSAGSTGSSGSAGAPGSASAAGSTGSTGSGSAGGAPPCTTAALSMGVPASGTQGADELDPNGYVCSGDWAAAGVTVDDNEGTWLFHAVGGQWTHDTTDTVDCSGGQTTSSVPASIVNQICNSN